MLMPFLHFMDILLESLSMGLAPAIVVAIYLVIIKFIDSSKETKRLQLENEKDLKINKNFQDISDSFIKLNTFLEYYTKDIIEKDDDKCKYAIKTSFAGMAKSIVNFSISTIINNNVDANKETIIDNISHLINTEYYNVYSCFLLYRVGNTRLSELLKDKWKQELIDDIVNIIFNKNLTPEKRIYTINNKVNIRVNDYCTTITNKYVEGCR